MADSIAYYIITLLSLALGAAGVSIFSRSRAKKSVSQDMERNAAVKATKKHLDNTDDVDLIMDVANNGRLSKKNTNPKS
jgi:hypothetical protein